MGEFSNDEAEMEDVVRENVREYGRHVMQIEADEEGAGFAYTIGVAKGSGQPELICFGLGQDVMHALLNDVCDRMAKGERFKNGDHMPELLVGFDCAFRRVSKSRYPEFFGYALRYHGGDGFEALQLVWPDKRGRFPWEFGYSAPASQQPAVWDASSSPGP